MEQIETIYDLCVSKGCPNELHMWGKALFPFPHIANPIFDVWLENCGNKSIIGRSEPAIRKFGLCSDHFTPDSFYDEDRKKLRKDAVPEPYSPTFKRSYPLGKANTKIYDHNYALVSNETENGLINYKRPLYPPRKYNAQSCPTPSSNCLNNNQANNGLKTASGNQRSKRGRPPCRIYGRKNSTISKNDGPIAKASCSIETVVDSNSPGPKTASRLAAGSITESLTAVNSAPNSIENIPANGRGRRAARGRNKGRGASSQVRGSGLSNGEVGILQETNDELRKQNKLLKKLNGQLKMKMKRSEDRNSVLKIMLEKVSSIDGFLDLHRCRKEGVRNLIKEQIHKCKKPSRND